MIWIFVVILAGWSYHSLRKWDEDPRRNPVLLKCSSCESKMKQHAWNRVWLIGDWCVWILFLSVTNLWNLKLPVPWLILIFISLSIAWNTARDRLYQAHWTWRHPVRCGKGGHAEPIVEGAP